jgi:long-chain acyl-CoA synthetase
VLAVPRIFEKIYNGAEAKAEAAGKGDIFRKAAAVAIAYSEALDKKKVSPILKLKHGLFDKLVYSKIRAGMGGRVEAAISGGAPLGARLGHFYRGAGVTVLEGYGLTETTAGATLNLVGAQRVGFCWTTNSGNFSKDCRRWRSIATWPNRHGRVLAESSGK